MNTEKIHLLIHSMSSAEKRHFNQTVRGGKNAKYVQLFDAIAKQKSYKEEALIKKFGYSSNLNSFSAAKSQLFKLVLKSLREFSSYFGEYQKILQCLKDIEILYARGLRAEALKATVKAKERAINNDWPVFMLLIEHWELELVDDEDLVGKERLGLGGYIDYRLQYELLYKRIYLDNLAYSSFSYHQSPNHCYPEIIGHELMQNYKGVVCERSKWHFCMVKIECHRSVRNTAEMSKWAKELLRVQNNLVSNGFYDQEWRLNGTYEYLHALLDNYEIDSFLKDFHLIRNLEYPAHREDLRMAKTRNVLVLQTYLFVISDKSEKKFEEIVEEVEAYIQKLRKESLHCNDLMLLLGMQYLFYTVRQDEKSVKWAAILDQYIDRKKSIKYYIVSKVLSLLSHYGLDNDLYIKSTLNSLERFIKKNNRLTYEFIFLFRLLNKLQDVHTRKEKESLLHDFKADMRALQKTNRKNHLLSAQSLMVWADNCLSKDDFLDTNRELFAPDLP